MEIDIPIKIATGGNKHEALRYVGQAKKQMNILDQELTIGNLDRGVRRVQINPTTHITCTKVGNIRECLITVITPEMAGKEEREEIEKYEKIPFLVVITEDNYIHLFEKSGKFLRSFIFDGIQPTIVDTDIAGNIYLGSDLNNKVCKSSQYGKLIWTITMVNPIRDLAVNCQEILVVSTFSDPNPYPYNNTITGVDGYNGDVLWTKGFIDIGPIPIDIPEYMPPTNECEDQAKILFNRIGTRVYAACNDGNLNTYNLTIAWDLTSAIFVENKSIFICDVAYMEFMKGLRYPYNDFILPDLYTWSIKFRCSDSYEIDRYASFIPKSWADHVSNEFFTPIHISAHDNCSFISHIINLNIKYTSSMLIEYFGYQYAVLITKEGNIASHFMPIDYCYYIRALNHPDPADDYEWGEWFEMTALNDISVLQQYSLVTNAAVYGYFDGGDTTYERDITYVVQEPPIINSSGSINVDLIGQGYTFIAPDPFEYFWGDREITSNITSGGFDNYYIATKSRITPITYKAHAISSSLLTSLDTILVNNIHSVTAEKDNSYFTGLDDKTFKRLSSDGSINWSKIIKDLELNELAIRTLHFHDKKTYDPSR